MRKFVVYGLLGASISLAYTFAIPYFHTGLLVHFKKTGNTGYYSHVLSPLGVVVELKMAGRQTDRTRLRVQGRKVPFETVAVYGEDGLSMPLEVSIELANVRPRDMGHGRPAVQKRLRFPLHQEAEDSSDLLSGPEYLFSDPGDESFSVGYRDLDRDGKLDLMFRRQKDETRYFIRHEEQWLAVRNSNGAITTLEGEELRFHNGEWMQADEIRPEGNKE